jgi:hypothetical protein
MARPKSDNPKILVSGCGQSYGSGELPTWVNVLQICGLNIKDLTGPGITNSLILNLLIDELHRKSYTHVICQLTSTGKLDVELNEKNKAIMEQDTERNYAFGKYWPSSYSKEHVSKRMYYDYLYSPGIEEKDLIIKILYLQNLCDKKNIKLCVFQGIKIEWSDPLHHRLQIWDNFNMADDYKTSEFYQHHEISQPSIRPNKHYQIFFAKKINDKFLKQDIAERLTKFK